MRRFLHWFDYQTKQRPFFSALIVLILVVVPGYARLETAVNKANSAAESSNIAAESSARTAKDLSKFVKEQQIRDAASVLANCQTRNTATKNGRDRFDTFFTAIDTIFTSYPNQTEEQKQRAHQFVATLRNAVPLDPTTEDVDCNDDGKLGPEDY